MAFLLCDLLIIHCQSIDVVSEVRLMKTNGDSQSLAYETNGRLP